MLRWARLLTHRFGGLSVFIALFLGLSGLIRLVLLLKAWADVSWDLSLLGAFAWGVVYDLGAALFFSIPLVLLLLIAPRKIFAWRAGRAAWHLFFILALALMVFGGVSEWFFWDEFGVRFNFIAVDYLVYTHEVIDNIRQSYPMPAIFVGIGLVAVALYAGLRRIGWLDTWLGSGAPGGRFRPFLGWAAAVTCVGFALNEESLPAFHNNFNRELAKNGVWSLFAAFRANQLEYTQFYPTLDEEAAFVRVRRALARDGSQPLASGQHDLLRQVSSPHAGPELRLNVIQITVESLSADFLKEFGNDEGITPNLDALAKKSLFFTQFYATGNRTDRGMEALTLSVPPTPGRSMVKRPENAGLFTLGSVFRSKGYNTAFVYGGYGYFDNMNAFFGGNGYRVVDRNQVANRDITFANAWGACDEDLFAWTLREADRDFAAGKPFFHFVMTTSNHRPFTYPDGRIDLPPKVSGRSGAVKYTDYAIGKFLRDAESKPWFKDTIFVIVADHCASSAGKTEIPVNRYHIPLFIYAPGGQLPKGTISAVSSQVDYAPTLLGLLNWSYPSRFFGVDVINHPLEHGRALVGNYQKLALFRDGKIGILKPVRQSAAYACDALSGSLHDIPTDQDLIDDAIAYYQVASHLFKEHHQSEYRPSSEARPKR